MIQSFEHFGCVFSLFFGSSNTISEILQLSIGYINLAELKQSQGELDQLSIYDLVGPIDSENSYLVGQDEKREELNPHAEVSCLVCARWMYFENLDDCFW